MRGKIRTHNGGRSSYRLPHPHGRAFSDQHTHLHQHTHLQEPTHTHSRAPPPLPLLLPATRALALPLPPSPVAPGGWGGAPGGREGLLYLFHPWQSRHRSCSRVRVRGRTVTHNTPLPGPSFLGGWRPCWGRFGVCKKRWRFDNILTREERGGESRVSRKHWAGKEKDGGGTKKNKQKNPLSLLSLFTTHSPPSSACSPA